MTLTGEDGFDSLPEEHLIRINQICNEFELAWQQGGRPTVESYLGLDDSDRAYQQVLFRELLPIEIEYARQGGSELTFQHYQSRFPKADKIWLERLLENTSGESATGSRLKGFSDQAPHSSPSDLMTASASNLEMLFTESHALPRFEPGARFSGRFQITGLLGRGGMGEVYHAEDLQLGQAVALKFLPKPVATDLLARQRLVEEIRTARQVTHPNVCRIHDLGESEDQIFLSMEYVEGEDLAGRLKLFGHIRQEQALDMAHQIASGLAAAHDAGVIHRDLKPGNIMIDRAGHIKILDFGLAGFQEDLTRQRSICGTPAYMAPELFTGAPPTVRSDIYAFGLVLYEIYTGSRAFDGENWLELQQQHETTMPKLLSAQVVNMDLDVERAIIRCLEKNADDRPASVQEVLTVLPLGGASTSGATKLLSPKRPVRDERKHITALLGDLVVEGNEVDSELEQEVKVRFMEELEPIVEKFGGTIEESIRDDFVVLFGIPMSLEDDAERALRSALEIQAVVSRLSMETNHRLGLYCGVNSGSVVVAGQRSCGRPVTAITGNVVALAAELKEVAGRGEILVGAATHTITHSLFDFASAKSISGKRGRKFEPCYRLLEPTTTPKRFEDANRIKSALVGRTHEMSQLQDAVRRLQNGAGGIVTLVGEAGLGKSRLIAELRDHAFSVSACYASENASVSQAVRRLQWVEGRCASFGGSSAYHLWHDALTRLLGVRHEDPPESVERALRQHVEILPSADLVDVHPYLAKLFSLPLADAPEAELRGLGPQGLKSGIFRAVQRFIESVIQRRGPLVIVCEDLHWADPTSIELLEQLLVMADTQPILLLCVFRPETEHGSWLLRVLLDTIRQIHGHRHVDVTLRPLPVDDSHQLVNGYLQNHELSGELQDRILASAEGNPFYIEEILRSLIANEAILRDGQLGCWHAAENASDVTLPDTIIGVIMARIDRLGEDVKRTLQLAAVIGRVFSFRVLEAVARRGRELEVDLLQLLRKELIRERSPAPQLEYIFKHQLTQEAAYVSLLRKERRVFHRQIAETLETLFPDHVEEQLELLAHHWESASAPDKAIDYLVRAGRKAASQFANSEALSHFQRALDLAAEDDRRDSILAQRAKVRLDTYQGAEARQDYELLVKHAKEKQDRRSELAALLGLAKSTYSMALHDPAYAQQSLRLCEDAFDLAETLDDKAGMVRALVTYSWFSDYWPECWDQAVANIEKAWSISQSTDDESLVFDSMIARANLDLASIDEVEELIERLESKQDLPRLKEACFRLTWRQLFAGNFRRCIELCDISISLAKKLGVAPVMYPSIKALALLELGKFDKANASSQQEVADASQPLGKALQAFVKGIHLLDLMAYDRAADVLASVIQQAKGVGRAWLLHWAEASHTKCCIFAGRWNELDLSWVQRDLAHTSTTLTATAPRLLGEKALANNSLDEALGLGQAAYTEAESQDWRPACLAAAELQLRVLLRLGRAQDAIDLAEQVLPEAHEIELANLVWQIQSAQAQAFNILGSNTDAAQRYHDAAAIIQNLSETIDNDDDKREFLNCPSVSLVLANAT